MADIQPAKTNLENPSEKNTLGVRFLVPYDLRDDYDPDADEFPLEFKFSDDTKKIVVTSFDEFFRLMNKSIWNKPFFGKDAALVTMKNKMEDAVPYNVFFTPLLFCSDTNDQLYTASFTDLLCPSLGKLKSSFHITFMADISWILAQFATRKLHNLPMTLLYGYTGFPWPKKPTMEELYPNIDYHYIDVKQSETALGCHHTKLSIFVYDDDSMRVVIGSANLYRQDWERYNQQFWVSPSCPKLPEGSSSMDGGSPTGFKFALIDYLLTYEKYQIPSIQEWIERIEKIDFSDIKVVLIYSSPGVHYPRKNGSILHYLGHVLSRDCTIPAPKKEHDSWKIVAQTASLGLIGTHPQEWLTTFLLKALGSHKDSPYYPSLYSISKIKFCLIYPSVKNVDEGYPGTSAFIYEKEVKDLQPWLIKMQYQWKADETKRTRAMSHSKAYCRISPCWQKMPYFFLTSANLSRSAWGKVPTSDCGIYVRSYEMGVLFLPKYFGEEYFEVKDTPNQRKNKRLFPMMFDLPLTPYGPDDDSFCGAEYLEHLKALKLAREQKKSNDVKNTDLESNVSELTAKLLPDTSDSRNITSDNKWDKNTDASSNSTETKKKDMKFNARPKTDMFFPSFNKKS